MRPSERAKAAFLTEYRNLCEQHGLMVVQVDSGGGYSPFCVAVLDLPTMDGMVQEMLLEPIWNILGECFGASVQAAMFN